MLPVLKLAIFNRITNSTLVSIRTKTSITLEKLGNIANIGIDLPNDRNRLDVPTLTLLLDTIKQLDADSAISAVSLHGIGGNFCTGSETTLPSELPTAITGHATGHGFELALLCDLRVMEDTAVIGLSDQYQGELSEDFTKRLIKSVGLSVALDLILTKRILKAKEAASIGLVNRVVECGTGIGQGYALAKSVGKFPSAIKYKTSVYATIR